MIKTALNYAKRGLYVFPCRVKDKRPATANGVKDATIDPDLIERWWREEPEFNIAVATGALSRIFVTDIDGLDAEAELKKLEAQYGPIPSTVELITARGRHLFFQYPEQPVRNSAGKLAPGIDVRGDGGYVLAPPSKHPSGRRYCWSVDSGNAFATAPEWLLARLAAPADGNGSVGMLQPSGVIWFARASTKDNATKLSPALLAIYCVAGSIPSLRWKCSPYGT